MTNLSIQNGFCEKERESDPSTRVVAGRSRRPDDAAPVRQGDSRDSLRSAGEFHSKKPRGSGPQVSLGLS